MNTQRLNTKLLITTAVASILLAACSTTMKAPEGSAEIRNKLTRLQANQELASRAPVAIKEAEVAVRTAERPERDQDLVAHRLVMANQKVDIAAARAQARLYEDQRIALNKDRESARLDSRTQEADSARQDAMVALADASSARVEADNLKSQLDDLKGRETERGIVITLGDVLFATGRSELGSGTSGHLAKLAAFLNQYPNRTVVIEGHTDSVGSESSNFSLSQRRADAVQSFLLHQGVPSNRLRTVAMGEGSPVAGNNSATDRQQNRRVEVIIEHDAISSNLQTKASN